MCGEIDRDLLHHFRSWYVKATRLDSISIKDSYLDRSHLQESQICVCSLMIQNNPGSLQVFNLLIHKATRLGTIFLQGPTTLHAAI